MKYFYFNINKNNEINNSRIIQSVLLIIILELLLFPFPSNATNNASKNLLQQKVAKINEHVVIPTKIIREEEKKVKISEDQQEPEDVKKVIWSKKYIMTAYNSDIAQCDASPCITANGFNVCEHGIEDTVAANFLPFGTEIRIPELFGDKIFTVRDRMNKRYTDRVDVWLLHKDNAIDFGVKYPLIEVLGK